MFHFILHGFILHGPAVVFGGAILSKLTNTGVTQPNGSTQYYPDPQSATVAASKQIPSADSMLSGDVLNPTMNVPPMPKVTQPTFADANASGPFSPALSTKGKALSLVLEAMHGAANGAAAGAVVNPHVSPGWGAGAAAG